MSIYRNIQILCREQGRSIMSLESELGFARGSIYKWDTNVPSIGRVKAVADVLRVPIERLLEGDADEQSNSEPSQ